jgi:hypothetical protein
MILDENYLTTHTKGLLKEPQGIFGVVEDIDKYDGIKAVVFVRNALAIKGLDGNHGFRPDQDVDSLEREVAPHLHEKLSDKAVTTAYIQNARVSGNQVRQAGTEHPSPAPGDKVFMDEIGRSHFLCTPMMLTMKLEKMF